MRVDEADLNRVRSHCTSSSYHGEGSSLEDIVVSWLARVASSMALDS